MMKKFLSKFLLKCKMDFEIVVKIVEKVKIENEKTLSKVDLKAMRE